MNVNKGSNRLYVIIGLGEQWVGLAQDLKPYPGLEYVPEKRKTPAIGDRCLCVRNDLMSYPTDGSPYTQW